MVEIKAGSFQMGQAGIPSVPEHRVTLTKGFYIGKYPVTQGQYQTVMRENPSQFQAPVSPEGSTKNRPVEMVSWYDAIVFCNKLSVKEGLTPAYIMDGLGGETTDTPKWGSVPKKDKNPLPAAMARWENVKIVEGSTGYRLPTEAQWEYACRAGTTTAYNTSDGVLSGNVGWYKDNSDRRTHSVGEKPANAWGLFDTHGNVYEWCWDRYGAYEAGAQTDPTGAVSSNTRVLRGGSWVVESRNLRSAERYNLDPIMGTSHTGFRIVRPLEEAQAAQQ
jgi:formylglycine-generating enzyme required for sulfatase activity